MVQHLFVFVVLLFELILRCNCKRTPSQMTKAHLSWISKCVMACCCYLFCSCCDIILVRRHLFMIQPVRYARGTTAAKHCMFVPCSLSGYVGFCRWSVSEDAFHYPSFYHHCRPFSSSWLQKLDFLFLLSCFRFSKYGFFPFFSFTKHYPILLSADLSKSLLVPWNIPKTPFSSRDWLWFQL